MEKRPLNKQDILLLSRYGLHDMDLAQAVNIVYKQDEYMFFEGDDMEYIYFVSSGSAKVFLSLSDGKQLLLAYFVSQGVIGDVELMTNAKKAYTTMQAVSDFTCVAVPLSVYGDALKSNATFIRFIARELAEKLIQRGINGTITTLQPLEARLCSYLSQTAKKGYFSETLTEVAGVVGSSYRHLLRCFDKLCCDGILKRESPGYRIIDRKALEDKMGDSYVLKWTDAGDLLL